MMKKNVTRVLCFLSFVVVIIFCIVFAGDAPFGTESTADKVADMSLEDMEVTILDEDTLRIENLIKGTDGETLYYCWVVKNYAENLGLSSGTTGEPMKNNDVIEITYEILERVEFQAVVVYDGYKYTSNTFCVQSDGSITMSEEETSTVETSAGITRDISDIVSLAYLAFLLSMVLLYYLVPKRFQWVVLVIASLIFYILSGVQYIVFIIASSWIAFTVAKKMSQRKQVMDIAMKEAESAKERKALKAELQRENRQRLMFALVGTLGVMVVIKYADFVISNINALLHTELALLQLVMPLGLSFYTFMLLAYLIDIYRGKYVAEGSFGRFFLFASFFPHVSQGPLARYNETAPQLREHHKFDYDNFCKAAQRILWGFFVKLVLADRIAILVNGIYDSYETQSFVMLIIGSLAYSIQIYADFYSSMEIAIGSAQLFGIHLQENFMRPYFSRNMPEFWRRWHISLGTWFKDYVFYPISISKRVMKFSVKIRKKYGQNVARVLAAAPPIMGVWILTGLWHGASWKFVAWGMFHGILILLSTAFSQNVQEFVVKLGLNTEATYYKILQMVKVFLLCTIGRVFFRASTIGAAFTIFWNIMTFSIGSSSLGLVDFTGVNLDLEDYIVLPIAIILLLIVSILQEKYGSVRELMCKWNIGLRWLIWILLVLITLIFGIYGPGTSPIFIYEAF